MQNFSVVQTGKKAHHWIRTTSNGTVVSTSSKQMLIARQEGNAMEIQTQLATSLTRYLNSLSGRNLSDHTATAYRTDLLQCLTWIAESDITVDSPEKITRT